MEKRKIKILAEVSNFFAIRWLRAKTEITYTTLRGKSSSCSSVYQITSSDLNVTKSSKITGVSNA